MTKHPPSESDPVADLLRRAALDEAPPAAVRERAIALRGPTRRAVERAAKLLRRIVAVAVPQGGVSPFAPALGVRGAAAAARQWLFRGEECEIDLRVAPEGEGWQIAGQLFGTPLAERVVLDGAGATRVADIGPTFEFGFTGLAAGCYSLTVQGGELEVVVPQLEIGGADPPS